MVLKGFERFLEVLSGFGMVLSGFQRDLEGFRRPPGGVWGARGPLRGQDFRSLNEY